jgi:hypothetical protein
LAMGSLLALLGLVAAAAWHARPDDTEAPTEAATA